jgi:aryl-alcohol dehydrogenase-like predicted oxidoreductase
VRCVAWVRDRSDQALADLLARIAEQKSATPAQLALAWLLVRKSWIVPIPGTTELHRLEENIGAAGLELTPGDISEMDRAAAGSKSREPGIPNIWRE